MNLLGIKLGQIKKLGLPKGQHKVELKFENGRVSGDDLPTVASVESLFDQAEDIHEGHTDADGRETWYESWTQQMDRNGWGRDMDQSRERSLRTQEISPTNTLVAEAVDGPPIYPDFPQISEREPASFSVQDTNGYVSMDYRWKDGQIASIQEVRSFPGQPIEELSLTVDDNGLILLETSVSEVRIPEAKSQEK